MSFPGWPSCVSVVVPARNAAATLEQAVASAIGQGVVAPLEVIIAVGPSDDETQSIADALATDSRVRVVANPAGSTPAGLNTAIAACRGDVVVRLDAHAILPPSYVQRAIDTLRETGAGNVGGHQIPTASEGFAVAVAAAMRSRVGSGGAAYRSATTARPVETVYLGVFLRQALDAVGGFDERLDRNQDYELNHRLRQAGWEVWLDPRLGVAYRPRGSVRALGRQYRDYGRFKRLVMRRHPSSIRLRQIAPLVMVGGVTVATVLGVVFRAWWLPAMAVGSYVGVVVVGALLADRRRALGVAVALATMHWSWAVGFLQGPRDS